MKTNLLDISSTLEFKRQVEYQFEIKMKLIIGKLEGFLRVFSKIVYMHIIKIHRNEGVDDFNLIFDL